MKRILIIICVLILGALTFGDCPEQVFQDYTTSPWQIDPNRIALDYETGQRLYLGTVTTEVGQPWQYLGYGCDPDGHEMVFSASGGVLDVQGVVYTLSGVQTSIGLEYIDITVTDIPDPNQVPKSRAGTLGIVALPGNQTPRLCGGRPETP